MSKVIVEGRNSVKEAVISGNKIFQILVAPESTRDEKIIEILSLCRAKSIPVRTVPARRIRQISKTLSHQNIIAEMEIKSLSLIEVLQNIRQNNKSPFFLAVNRLDYEHNLGAIMRSAWGAGVDALLVASSGVHEITPAVSKVAMGAASHLPVITESLFPALKLLHDEGIRIIGVEEGSGKTYFEENLTGPVCFVVGGEDSGLSDALKKYCDCLIHIPLTTGLSSLNVSVATAIVLFEKVRQETIS